MADTLECGPVVRHIPSCSRSIGSARSSRSSSRDRGRRHRELAAGPSSGCETMSSSSVGPWVRAAAAGDPVRDQEIIYVVTDAHVVDAADEILSRFRIMRSVCESRAACEGGAAGGRRSTPSA